VSEAIACRCLAEVNDGDMCLWGSVAYLEDVNRVHKKVFFSTASCQLSNMHNLVD
jgi:hypothetical protein